MNKRKFFAIIAAVSMIVAVSCQRKGTGCPQFSQEKFPVEQEVSKSS